MTQVDEVGTLQIAIDEHVEHWEWRAQRAGWVLLALVILGGLLGLFSNGPWSSITARQGKLGVDYQRFARSGGPTEMRARIEPARSDEAELRLWMSRDFVRGLHIDQIMPRPDRVTSAGDRVVFVFGLDRPGQAAEIKFDYQPDGYGRLTGQVGLEEGPTVEIEQFVYP